MNHPDCRFCNHPLTDTFCNLGISPVSNAYLSCAQLNQVEEKFPLHALVCRNCFLVQIEEFQSPKNIFKDYAYFSSYSSSWLSHCEKYTQQMIQRFQFNAQHQVIEIASNDGYLLQFFKQKSIPVLGIEPAENVAKVAQEKGIPTLTNFFGKQIAESLKTQGIQADLLLGNNVLAHVPYLNDFVEGMKVILKPSGIITMEFPHLHCLMKFNQFDTIYHEHFSYFSFLTVIKVFARHGLKIFDVDQIPTHGGSLRIYACHEENDFYKETERSNVLKAFETDLKYNKIETYLEFDSKIKNLKNQLRAFLDKAFQDGKKVVAYGAPAKGNTLLNYCQIPQLWVDYTVDLNPHKQGKYLPGTKIPIFPPKKIFETKPDYLLILPWNLKEEIFEQMQEIKKWSGKFVIPIPQVEIIA